ncbi:hypothetical protein DF185_19855 [Marinifilum breve]|uniref:Uncharacterized protein n=1 Tax=Marinifilum breve TaxID=2184082 RepID=A0A2V3ZT84_9BACT|nr:hypothetical protein [Marinifilum breve]PXX96897.1 hypothetical protein DF185_19855 [Marinifilum breve]
MIHKVKYPEDQGGIWKFWFAPEKEVSNISDVINGIVNSVSLLEGCSWSEIEFAQESAKLQIKEKDTADGVVYNIDFTVFIPGDSLAFTTLLAKMDQHKFVLIVKDHRARMRLLGVDVALTYTNSFNSGEKVEDRKGYVLKFSAQLPENPPYLFSQDLVDEFNRSNEELEMVPHVATGEQGPAGPMPDHRWNGSKLQLQKPNLSWGAEVDLRGEVPAHRWVGTSLQFQNEDGTWGVAVNLKGVDGDDANIDLTPYAKKVDVHNPSQKALLDSIAITANYLEQNGGEVWVANADRLGNISAADYWNKTELVNDSLYLKIANDKIKAGYADIANDANHLGGIAAADYFNKYNADLPTINWEMADAIVNGTFTTKNFAPGIIGGVGGRMDQAGNMELQSLIVREFIRTPELIKNQVRVAGNEFWFTDPGIIQDVSGTGPYTITYKIEEGDGVSHKVDDILIGIYNDGNGFETAYFDVVSVDLANNQAVLNSRNGIAPSKYMVLARKGNETDTDRQTSVFVDGLNGFICVLGGVNDHNTDFSNIITQIGYLNMHSAVFGDMDKGIYVKDNGYFENVKVSGEIHVTGGNAATQADVALVDTKADTAYNLADLKITEADAVTITHREIKAPYIATLGLKVGDEILMGENAVISWERVNNVQIASSNIIDNTAFKNQAYTSGRATVVYVGDTVQIKKTSSQDSDCYFALNKTIPEEYIGKELTFSCQFSADWNINVQLRARANTVDEWTNTLTVNDGDRRKTLHITFTPDSTSITLFVYSTSIIDLTLHDGFMLAEGSKPIVWSPSFLDIQNDAQAKADAAEIAATAVANTAQSKADSAYSLAGTKITVAEATVITQDTVTAPFIAGLSLQVGNEIVMGANARISWNNVDDNENVETITGSQSKADSAENSAISVAAADATNKANAAESNATAVANAAQSKADSAYSLADTKITVAEATVITQNTVTSPFIAGLSLQVGNEIAMGSNAVIAWDKVTDVQINTINLLNNTYFEDNSYSSGRATVQYIENTLKFKKTLSSDSDCYLALVRTIPEEYIGKELTFSCEFSADWNINMKLRARTGDDNTWSNTLTVNNGDRRKMFSLTFIPTSTSVTLFIYSYSTIDITLHDGFQLTQGNKPAPWSRSINDVDDNITTITNNTIATTNVIAEQMKVRAVNILDQLTAAQINFDNASGNNVHLTGHIEAESGNVGDWIIQNGILKHDGNEGSSYLGAGEVQIWKDNDASVGWGAIVAVHTSTEDGAFGLFGYQGASDLLMSNRNYSGGVYARTNDDSENAYGIVAESSGNHKGAGLFIGDVKITRNLEVGGRVVNDVYENHGSTNSNYPTNIDMTNKHSLLLGGPSSDRYYKMSGMKDGQEVIIVNRNQGNSIWVQGFIHNSATANEYYGLEGGGGIIAKYFTSDFYLPSKSGGYWVIIGWHNNNW